MSLRQLSPPTHPKSRALLLCCLLAGCGLLPLSAAEDVSLDVLEQALLDAPADAEAAFVLATAYRDADQHLRGVEFLSRFHESHEPNSMSLVWQGSLKTALSSNGGDVEKSLTLLQGGIGDMDRAVRLFPKDSQVRLIRGVTISFFPSFLEMSGRAISDLKKVLAVEGLSAGSQSSARVALARAYRKAGREEEAEKVESASRP